MSQLLCGRWQEQGFTARALQPACLSAVSGPAFPAGGTFCKSLNLSVPQCSQLFSGVNGDVSLCLKLLLG